LLPRYRPMLRRLVAKPAVERDSPHHAHGPEHDEDGAPRQKAGQISGQQRSQTSSEVSAREEDTLHLSALPNRDPAREDARRIWPCARLANAEQEPYSEQ